MVKQGEGVYAAFLFLPKSEDGKEDAYSVVVFADTMDSTGQTELAEDITD